MSSGVPQMKRFIDIHIPISQCNFKCHYCYVGQTPGRKEEESAFKYTPEFIGKALSAERLGGVCHFTVCSLGETMIPVQIIDILESLLRAGHYVMVVTNGVLTSRFEAIARLDPPLLERLCFKFSFHYLELIKRGLLDVFFENIERMQGKGCSFTVEITSNDEIEPYIDEIKKIMLERVGALCHVSIPRDEANPSVPLLSRHTLAEYVNIWSTFDSSLFDFKVSTWQIKRKEYCYAGAWSGLLNIGNGDFCACYRSKISQNIFADISKPIRFIPVGRHCQLPHCYNSHSFLTLGDIPGLQSCNYASVRNRICSDGSQWLTPRMNAFLSNKLVAANEEYGLCKKMICECEKLKLYAEKFARKGKWFIKKEIFKSAN